MSKRTEEWPESNRSFVICRRMYNYIKKFKSKPDENGFKRISRFKILNEGTATVGRWSSLESNMHQGLSYLVKYGYLEIDHHYEVGKFPKGYKILKEWDFKDPKKK